MQPVTHPRRQRACSAEFARRGFGFTITKAAGAPTSAHGAPSPTNGTSSPTASPVAPLPNDPAVYDAAMVEEIKKAQGGYVGAHFFVTRWWSAALPEIPDFRRRTLDRVVAAGKAEVYLTEDGIQAVRVRG